MRKINKTLLLISIHVLLNICALNLESWGKNNPECFHEMGGDERWWRRIMWLHVHRVGEHAPKQISSRPLVHVELSYSFIPILLETFHEIVCCGPHLFNQFALSLMAAHPVLNHTILYIKPPLQAVTSYHV